MIVMNDFIVGCRAQDHQAELQREADRAALAARFHRARDEQDAGRPVAPTSRPRPRFPHWRPPRLHRPVHLHHPA
jgi:hypothetical protein